MEAELFAALKMEEPVLDLGCGNGLFAEIALGKPVKMGFDADFSQVRQARLSGVYRYALVADACHLPYKDRSFATIISNCVTEHIHNLGKALEEVSRVLMPGGRFFFTVPTQKFNDWFYLSLLFGKLGLHGLAKRQIERYNHHQFHYHVYSVQEWALKLEQAGLIMEEHRYYASQSFLILFSTLDDIHHILGGLFSPKTGSSETRTSKMAMSLAESVSGNLLAGFWRCLLMHFYRKEMAVDCEGAAVLFQAGKRVS